MSRSLGDAEARSIEAELSLDSWNGFRDLPPEQAVIDGVTAGQLASLFGRPDTPAGAVYQSRVVFGTAGAGGRDLHLYLYARADSSERSPGVVFIHGGGWHELTPFAHIRACAELAAQGFVTATIHYRLTGEATWPAAIEDCKAAIRWMRAHAPEIGLDSGRLAVAGNSAGGHLAAMVALTAGTFEGHGGNPGVSSRPQAAVLVSPAADLLHPANPQGLETGFDLFLGGHDEASIRAANPPTYLDSGCPPVLILTGDSDPITPLPMVRDFQARLDAMGIANTMVIHPGGHGFELFPDGWRSYIDQTVDFLHTWMPASPFLQIRR